MALLHRKRSGARETGLRPQLFELLEELERVLLALDRGSRAEAGEQAADAARAGIRPVAGEVEPADRRLERQPLRLRLLRGVLPAVDRTVPGERVALERL